MRQKKDEKVTIVEEPYTCTSCGRQNLKFTEIVFRTDSEEQIIESSVLCQPCFLKSPVFLKLIAKTPEAARGMDKLIEQMDYKYNRRMLRRVLKKKD